MIFYKFKILFFLTSIFRKIKPIPELQHIAFVSRMILKAFRLDTLQDVEKVRSDRMLIFGPSRKLRSVALGKIAMKDFFDYLPRV